MLTAKFTTAAQSMNGLFHLLVPLELVFKQSTPDQQSLTIGGSNRWLSGRRVHGVSEKVEQKYRKTGKFTERE